MRLHTDTVTTTDVYRAVRDASDRTGAPIYVEVLTSHGSRRRAGAIELQLSSDGTLSRRRRNPGTSRDRSAQDDYAATWDQWGWVLAYLYTVDSRMVAGPYADAAHFHARTRDEYR